jgi:DNA-binding phage protein
MTTGRGDLKVTKHKKGMDEKHRRWTARALEVDLHLKDLEARYCFLDNILDAKYGDLAVRANQLIARVRRAAGEARALGLTVRDGEIPRGLPHERLLLRHERDGSTKSMPEEMLQVTWLSFSKDSFANAIII